MEASVVMAALLLLAVVVGPWVLSGLALRRARRAEARLDEAERKLSGLERRLAGAPAAAPWPSLAAPPPLTPPLETAPVPPPAATEPPPGAAAAPAPPPIPLVAEVTSPGVTAPPASFEEKVALVWFTRLGALTFLLGAGWFFKYAVDNDWIGPLGRVALGAVVGAGILALGEARRDRLRALYLHALLGTGVAVLFAAAYAAHALYHLVPAPASFGAVAVIALLGGALALRHRGELILVLALAGGLAAPVVLSTGEDRPAALFGYLLVLTGLALWAAAREGFRVAPWFAVAGPCALFAGWYERYFDVAGPLALPGGGFSRAAGAYHGLPARVVPILAVAAFAGAWLAVGEAARRRDRAGRWPLAMKLAALLLAHAGMAALLFDRRLPLIAALLALGALSDRVLGREGRSQLLAAPLVASFLALLAADLFARESGVPGVLAAAAWAALYLGASALALLGRREEPTPLRLANACAPALGLLCLALLATSDGEGLVRSAAAAGAGAAELAIGARLLGRARRAGSLLLGEALGLFAASAAFLLSGASVTLVWAALAAVVAHLAAQARDRDWLIGAGLLFAAVLVRLVHVDVPAPDHELLRFYWSHGGEGAAEQRFLLNPRGLALAGAAAAFFLAARSLARASGRLFRGAGATALGLGHALLLALVVLEVRGAATPLPRLPAASGAAAIDAWWQARAVAVAAATGRLDMLTTLAMGAFAALLVGIGFAARERLHRWLGLGLFAVTFCKLALHDVWGMERVYQIAVFLAVGALLLGASFLYARYGSRLVGLLRGPGPGAGLVLALAAMAGGRAQALDARPFTHAAPVEGITAPGLWRVEIPAELWRASSSPETLADVRVAGPGGEEVQWVLREEGEPAPERTYPATLVDPVVLPDGAARAVLDLGPAHGRHGEARLEVAGDEFLRRARVEVSADGRRWGVAADGGRVWAVRGDPAARGLTLRYPASDSRFLRVTLLPGQGPVRITGAQVLRVEARREAPLRELPVAIARVWRDASGRRTLLEIDPGGRATFATELRVATGAPAFERRAQVLASDGADVWYAVGSGVLWRSPDAGPGERDGLSISARPGRAKRLRLVIEDGDAPPLAVERVALAWPAQELVLGAGAPGPHVLHAGAPGMAAPAYDLAGVIARGPGGEPPRARLGPLARNPAHAPAPPPRAPFTERHRGALAGALAALVAALAAWTVRLLRRGPGPA